ncbi:OPT superfamily [Sorochytrium milnesiophthora]
MTAADYDEKARGAKDNDDLEGNAGETQEDTGFVIDKDYEDNIKALLPLTDDVNIPSLTFRVWVMGTLFCCFLGWVNQILTFRTNTFVVTAYMAVMLSYPLGKLMARLLPRNKFHIPLVGECSLNPGPYSAKETILIYVMASTGTTGVYGTDNLFVQKYFYNMDIGAAASVFFLLATMLSGFGVAGFCQRFLVRPSHMLWPSALPQIALVNSFHAADTSDKDPDIGEHGKRHMSRLVFFAIAALGMFVYELLPGFAAPSLTGIGLLCLFSNNRITQAIGSPQQGVGVLSLTFDWNLITGAAMNFPWWVQVNIFTSVVVFVWILTPLSWQGNWFGNPPFADVLNSPTISNRTGDIVGAGDLVDHTTFSIIPGVYEAQKPFWISPFFAWSYFASLAIFAASLTHALVWYGKDIWRRVQSTRLDQDKHDIHCQLIDKYPAVPRYWYYGFFLVPTVIGIVVCHATGINMPWYLSVLSIFTSLLVTIPFAIIQATSGTQLATNVISEFLVGTIYPGHPIVMMAFKCFSVTVSMAVLTLLQDLKVGHYMKIAPRHMFIAQMYSQIVAVIVCYATFESYTANPEHVDWIVNSKKYTHDPVANKWNSQGNYGTYFNASLIWGALGPVRFFFTSYGPLVIAAFVTGIVLPVLLKLGHEYVGGPIPWALINAPLLLNVPSPGGNQAGPLMSFVVSFIFQFYVYRYRTKWWQRYNYVLSTAFDVATALLSIVTVYGLQSVTMPTWALNPATAQDFCPNVTPDKQALSA